MPPFCPAMPYCRQIQHHLRIQQIAMILIPVMPTEPLTPPLPMKVVLTTMLIVKKQRNTTTTIVLRRQQRQQQQRTKKVLYLKQMLALSSNYRTQIKEHVVHAHGRAAGNLTLKGGLSGCVMDASAARHARNSGGQSRNSYVWFLTSNLISIEYYPLHVARLTNYKQRQLQAILLATAIANPFRAYGLSSMLRAPYP